MIRSLPLLAVFALFNACSLLHDELPNESPTLQISRSICQSPEMAFPDTIVNGSGGNCRVRRGGEVRFEVRATDEDDDPLVYHWEAFGAGSFRDSSAVGENSWFAPETIVGSSESFVIQIAISDRDCNSVPDPDDRQACSDNAEEIIESFLVEVVQRRPILSVTTDTTISFSQPQILIDAFGYDPDGDALEYNWQPVEGEDGLIIGQQEIRDDETFEQIGSRGAIVALYPNDYLLRTAANGDTQFPASYHLVTSIDDGEGPVESEIVLQFSVEPPLPEGGMVQLTLSETGEDFEIDIYEYPNVKGEFPLQATFFEAVSFCSAQGKRLCSPSESQAACQGDQQASYSSTDDPLAYAGLEHFGVRFCNTPRSVFTFLNGGDLTNSLAAAGSFPNCGGTTGVFDLTGNIGEWTATLNETTGELAVFTIASNVALEGTCSFVGSVGTLSLDGADIYDPAVLQQQKESMNEIILQSFESDFVGFRCCR